MLNGPDTSIPESLESIAIADVFIGSEDPFSRAAVVLSKNVKVLTDRWEEDEEEGVLTLHPANIVAGREASAFVEELRKVIENRRESSQSPAFAMA